MSIALPPAAGRGAAHSGAGAPVARLARTALALVAVTTASALALEASPALAADACANAALRATQQASNLPDCRAYELVSPPDKAGHSVDWRKNVQSSSDGNAVAFSAPGPFGDALTGVEGDYYVARRSASSWSSHGIDAPQSNFDGQVSTPTMKLADNLSRAFQFSGRALLPGAIEGGGNLYLTDTQTDTRELVAASSGFQLRDELAPYTTRTGMWSSSDLSHMVFPSTVSLLPEATSGATNVYEYANGHLRLVNILEDGTVDAGASIGSDARSSRVVSADGSKVFFTSSSGVLYARVNGTTTVPISVSRRAGDPSTPVGGTRFGGASKDGNVVYFLSSTPLTDDTPGGGFFPDVYRYDFRTDRLTNESLSSASPQPANVLTLNAVSEDGEYVYFYGWGQLTPDAVPFQPNFYVAHNGEVRLVAIVNPTEPFALSTSRNGRYAAFVSARRLTLADNTDPACRPDNAWANDPGVCVEVYLYDAVAGTLTCPGCDPVDGRNRFADLGLRSSRIDYLPTVVTDDGRLFFSSEARLVDGDTNGLRDVYEWDGQRARLVSSGRGADESRLADVSADGRDVYFLTAQRLVAQDADDAMDLYVARAGGGLAAQNVPPAARDSECDGDACQGSLSGASVPAFTGSVTFAGPADGSERDKATAKPSVSRVGTVRGVSTRIRVKVAGRGRIQVSGSGLRPAARTVTKAGTYELVVALSERARQTLSRKHRVRVRVRVRFTPGGGKSQSVQVPVTFEPKAKVRGKSSSRSVRRVVALSSDARKGR